MKLKTLEQNVQTTKLHQAALNGDLVTVKSLMRDADAFNDQLHFVDYNNNLPLDRAAPRGHFEIVEILVKAHKKPGNEYVMHNPQNYFPFLSAVRWYLKVLDNAKNQLNVGVFNTGKNASEDYVKIIQLLAKEYPETLAIQDNKGLNALDYAIIHLSNTSGKKNQSAEKIIKIEALIEMLMDFNLSYNVHRQMPHVWKKVGTQVMSMEQTRKKQKPAPADTKENQIVTNSVVPLKSESSKDTRVSSTGLAFFNPAEKSRSEAVYERYMKSVGL